MDYILSTLLAVVIGLVLGAYAVVADLGDDAGAYRDAMEICQADLPRSQKCIITAVPEVAE